ncbi:MAG: IS66 family transposase [Acidobacteriota bacterium]
MTDDEARKLTARVAALEQQLEIKDGIIAELLKRLYGAKSEKIDSDQLLLDLLRDEPKKPAAAGVHDAPAAEPDEKQPGKKQSRRQKLRDSLKGLPTVTTEIIPREVLDDPQAYRRIGEERSERLEVSPAAFTRHVTVRPTYVRKADPDTKPTTAPLPTPLLEGSVLSASLGAHLLSEKFCYHQPFWRQQWKLRATHGIELSRNLMCHWHNHLADLLLPVYELIAANLRASDYLKVDETPIKYLDPGTGKTSTGQFWVYHHDEHGPLYDWHTSHANTCLDRVLLGGDDDGPFAGYLQSDGLRAYMTFIERQPENAITPVSCLAHIRRKFVEAQGDHPKISAWILYQIGKIYAHENEMRNSRAGPEERRRAREESTRRHYQHLKKLAAHLEGRRSITPASRLGKALSYARAQLPHLEPCFADGRIEFDNNLTENAVRPTKLGMKNWMFIGGAATGWRSAVIYTMVEQVRRHGHDPFAYFKWVFERLPGMTNQDDFAPLLPSNWVAAQEAQQEQAA